MNFGIKEKKMLYVCPKCLKKEYVEHNRNKIVVTPKCEMCNINMTIIPEVKEFPDGLD
jgi:ribosomal protein L37AE/L43A